MSVQGATVQRYALVGADFLVRAVTIWCIYQLVKVWGRGPDD